MEGDLELGNTLGMTEVVGKETLETAAFEESGIQVDISGEDVVETDVKVVTESAEVNEKSELPLDERELEREIGDIGRGMECEII